MGWAAGQAGLSGRVGCENFGAVGHIGPPSSSAFGAPPLRYGRFAVTTPVRCGFVASKSFAAETGSPPVSAAKLLGAKRLSRAEGSRFAKRPAKPARP